MKLLLSVPIFVFILTSCFKEIPIIDDFDGQDSLPNLQPTTNYIFDMAAVPEIRLTFPLAEWNRLLANFDLNPRNQEYVVARFAFSKQGNTEQLDSIGIRLRGNTSRRRPEGYRGQMHDPVNPDWHHAHFGIHFEEFIPKQEFSGTDRLHLKWFKDDGNYVREVYCYDLFRRFGVWTAPRSTYCRLSILIEGDSKPAYYGVYEMVESIQEQYLTDRLDKGFLSDSGNLWKCTWGADFNFSPDPWEKMGIEEVFLDASQSREFAYDLKTHQEQLLDAKLQLWQFIRNLNEKEGDIFNAWISEAMDVALFLRTYAVNVMVGMWDDYWVNQNNFYFYFDANGMAYFIPYDYDNTLGTSLLMANSGTQPVLEWGDMHKRPLINKILAIPEYQSVYLGCIQELIDGEKDFFDAEKSMRRIRTWQSMIREYIPNDTGEDMTMEDVTARWASCDFYRLLSGNDQGGKNGTANYFLTRVKHALDLSLGE